MISPGRVCFTILGIDVMWYGVLIGLGMFAGVFVIYHRAPAYGIEKEHVLDVALFAVPAAVIGARAYYVAFEWEHYAGDIAKILNIRNGGLAVHGGILFGLATAALICRHYGIKCADAMDLTAPGLALGQSIGRWGNFFNEEAHGCATNLPINVLIDGTKYHPTFLYESLWCCVLCIFLILFSRQKLANGSGFSGQIFLLYCMLYSLERFFVEALRTDSLMIGPFRQARVISACIMLAALVVYIHKRKKVGEK